jgi:hypothetical protein
VTPHHVESRNPTTNPDPHERRLLRGPRRRPEFS